jgi:glycerol-3-phosphate dehydrogenase (NAD(P)+)
MGLAGLGDLVLTCTGDLSRNRRLGLALGRGASAGAGGGRDRPGGRIAAAPSTRSMRLGHRHGLELPITEHVQACCTKTSRRPKACGG